MSCAARPYRLDSLFDCIERILRAGDNVGTKGKGLGVESIAGCRFEPGREIAHAADKQFAFRMRCEKLGNEGLQQKNGAGKAAGLLAGNHQVCVPSVGSGRSRKDSPIRARVERAGILRRNLAEGL